MAPLLGPHFKRLLIWWAMSGKAMQGSVPPAGTVRDVTRRKSEGHGARVCGLFITEDGCICRAKILNFRDPNHEVDKSMTTNDLVPTEWLAGAAEWKSAPEGKCRTMHIRCIRPTECKSKTHRRFNQQWARSQNQPSNFSCCLRPYAAFPAESDTAATDR